MEPEPPQIVFASVAIASGRNLTARLEDVVRVECSSAGGNPPAAIRWFVGEFHAEDRWPVLNTWCLKSYEVIFKRDSRVFKKKKKKKTLVSSTRGSVASHVPYPGCLKSEVVVLKG